MKSGGKRRGQRVADGAHAPQGPSREGGMWGPQGAPRAMLNQERTLRNKQVVFFFCARTLRTTQVVLNSLMMRSYAEYTR